MINLDIINLLIENESNKIIYHTLTELFEQNIVNTWITNLYQIKPDCVFKRGLERHMCSNILFGANKNKNYGYLLSLIRHGASNEDRTTFQFQGVDICLLDDLTFHEYNYIPDYITTIYIGHKAIE